MQFRKLKPRENESGIYKVWKSIQMICVWRQQTCQRRHALWQWHNTLHISTTAIVHCPRTLVTKSYLDSIGAWIYWLSSPEVRFVTSQSGSLDFPWFPPHFLSQTFPSLYHTPVYVISFCCILLRNSD